MEPVVLRRLLGVRLVCAVAEWSIGLFSGRNVYVMAKEERESISMSRRKERQCDRLYDREEWLNSLIPIKAGGGASSGSR
jgi:hypothetical protein